MSSRRTITMSVVVALLALAIIGTVAYGINAGISEAQRRSAVRTDAVVTGTLPVGTAAGSGATNIAAAPGVAAGSSAALGAPVADAIAQPAGGFMPGGPPYSGAGGVAADGISAWGVAYRQVSDPNAQADTTLIKAAYTDAEKRANDLAAATGNHLGKLVALSDYSANQPYFKPCIESGVPAPGRPAAPANGATGSGSSGSAGTATTAIAPAPCQANSNNQYLVVWVFVRHAL